MKFIIFVFGLFLFNSTANAMEFSLVNSNTNHYKILMKGDIKSGDVHIFANWFNEIVYNNKIDGVILDSLGGNVYDAIQLSKIIKVMDYDTYVINNCKSACTLMFFAGKNKYMSSMAEIGIHRAFIFNTKTNNIEDSNEVTYSMMKIMQKYNVSEKVLIEMMTTPGDKLTLLDNQDIKENHIQKYSINVSIRQN